MYFVGERRGGSLGEGLADDIFALDAGHVAVIAGHVLSLNFICGAADPVDGLSAVVAEHDILVVVLSGLVADAVGSAGEDAFFLEERGGFHGFLVDEAGAGGAENSFLGSLVFLFDHDILVARLDHEGALEKGFFSFGRDEDFVGVSGCDSIEVVFVGHVAGVARQIFFLVKRVLDRHFL